MKSLIALFTLLLATSASQALAQVTPDVDFKGTTSTDPLLKSDGGILNNFTLDFPMPKALAGLSLNFSSTEDLKKFSLNFQPVMELISMLENKGAKVIATPVEIKDLLALNVSVDGKPLKDLVVVNCNSCVIVFEY